MLLFAVVEELPCGGVEELLFDEDVGTLKVVPLWELAKLTDFVDGADVVITAVLVLCLEDGVGWMMGTLERRLVKAASCAKSVDCHRMTTPYAPMLSPR